MRIVFLLGLVTCCQLFSPPFLPLTGAAQEHLDKSTEGMISDFEARLTLARLLSNRSDRLDEAIDEYRILLGERPGDARLRIELSNLLMRVKRYPEAIQQLQTVLETNPTDRKALTALARTYLWSGRSNDAAKVFDRLADFESLPPDVLLEMARAYTWNREYDKAAEVYLSLLKRESVPHSDVLVELGNVKLYSGRIPQAIDWYRKALGIDPDSLAARKQLALALSWSGQDEEALPLLTHLYLEDPEDKEVSLALARSYVALDRYGEAKPIIRSMMELYPEDVMILADLADLEAGVGHAAKCRELYLKAIALSESREQLFLRYAAQMNIWGDFYGVESIYRNHLAKHPADFDVATSLAWLLVSAQRYEEAEGLYLKLLQQNPQSQEVLLDLSKLKLLEKDFKASLRYAERLLTVSPQSPEGLFQKGEALYNAGRYSEALQIYKLVTRVEPQSARGPLAAGKTRLKMGDEKEAKQYFETAVRIAPRNIEALFWITGVDRATSNDFTARLLAPNAQSPAALVEWARLYASQRHNRIAISCCEQALKSDPENFPARLGLAEILAVDHQYERADKILKDMAEEFPNSSKILITRARVLGWAKRYDQSIALYDRICKLNPSDPTPQKEKARTAAWGKKMETAGQIYAEAYKIPVDRTLADSIQALAREEDNPHLTKLSEQLLQTSQGNSVYTGYEVFFKEIKKLSGSLSPETAAKLEEVRLDLLPSYRIQKAAYLESRSKRLAWNRKFIRALDSYEDLIDFQPGNEEALFDHAQVECSLGLCDREAASYENLLAIDPLHLFAEMGLERAKIRSAPSLEAGGNYWEEEGRGGLSQITRYRTDFRADVPLSCRFRLSAAAHHWLEDPGIKGISYDAYGPTFEVSGILNEIVSGAASWTHKEYAKNNISSTDAGFARLGLNLWDYARLGMGYERSDELYNIFGVKQSVQADSFWVGASSYLTRYFEVQSKAQFMSYNDGNEGRLLTLGAGYAFTDHPRIVKLTIAGEYRDTDHDNIFLFRGSELVDIIHPYWAPQDYLAATAILEWRHDISQYFFCGSELHFYDLRLGIGTDSDDNPSVKLEGEWRYEFKDHWAIGVKGLIQRSEEWDANGAWATIRYRF